MKESCWGVKEGSSHDGWLQRWTEGETIEGAESFAEFTERVRSGLDDIFQLPSPILIVSQGGVYMTLQKILRFPLIDLGNCAALFHRPPAYIHHPWFVYAINDRDNVDQPP